MPGRKKRLKKGMQSIEEQIEIHAQKLESAKKEGNIGLSNYYEKEIERLRSSLARKKRILEGSD